MTQLSQTQIDLCTVLDDLKQLLLQKNLRYGDSAIRPIRIFSHSGNMEQIKVRIDDKLSRIRNGLDDDDEEDAVMDLMGYLVLLKVAQLQEKRLDEFVVS